MSATVSDISIRVHTLLNEAAVADSARRWTDAELFLWIADGQREIGKAIAAALSETTTITLLAGPRQVIPPTWDLLLRIVRNASGPTVRTVTAGQVRRRTAPIMLVGGALQYIPSDWEALIQLGGPTRFPRMIDGRILSASDPDWASRKTSNCIDEYIYDPQVDPRVFYVNPPAASGTMINATGILSLEAWYSDAGSNATIVEEYFYHPAKDMRTFYVNPGVVAGVQVEAVGRKIVPAITSLVDSLIVPEIFIPALSLYVAHRAMQKQSDYALAGIANAFFQEYLSATRMFEETAAAQGV